MTSMRDGITQACIRERVGDILHYIGEDVDRPGLKETPERVAAYLLEVTSGYDAISIPDLVKTFEDGAESYDEMIFEGNLPLFSLCEHHVVPFFGVAHVGYIPNGKIVGLSKLPRLLDVFARRLQVQERLTTQVADALMEHLKPKGVGVVIRARHLCIEMRGIRKIGATTVTSALRGVMKEQGAREEFLQFVSMSEQRSGGVL